MAELVPELKLQSPLALPGALSLTRGGPQTPAFRLIPSPVQLRPLCLALTPACLVGSLLPAHLGVGQSFQLLGQLLHVGVHDRLLDLKGDGEAVRE